jgi:hypothetical protein
MIVQSEIEERMLSIARECEARLHEVAHYGQEAAHAEVTYKVAFAQALLSSELKTVAEREAAATVETGEKLLARRIAEAKRDAAKEAGLTYRAQLSTMQSINANLRPLVT